MLEPVAVGVKVTDAVHVAPAASELPQVLVCAYGAAVEIELIEAAAVPVLEIVTLCAALVVPVFWLPKESELGEAESVALGEPLPDRPPGRSRTR